MFSKRNPMKYFSGNAFARLPLYKLVAGGSDVVLTASIGLGVMAASFTPQAQPEPTPEPTPANFDGLAEQPTTVFAEGEQPNYTTTADASMNLRAGPGTDFDKVTSVPAGTAVTALGTNSDGSWVVVQVGGQYGWLKVEFLNQ